MKKPIPKKPPNKKENKSAEKSLSESSFFVVGIGASAGGLDSLEKFFGSMPDNTGMAFIVVTHLDPDHVSILPELIQKSTKMKLFQAADGMQLKQNHIYVAPANRELSIQHKTIRLKEPKEAHGLRLPIDSFFKSLASDVGEKAICIILSGMASDGSSGLKSVKSEFGMVMVQDPKSAKYDGMPASAIKTGLADCILSPEEMPDRLIKYISSKLRGVLLQEENKDERIPDEFHKIIKILRTGTGHDFSLYKQNTICRRIEKRMSVSQMNSLPDYIRFLQENPLEIESLFSELLIGVTSFFRDPDSYVQLKKSLLKMTEEKPENGQIRIWVPGCYTGEEAYTIAIIIHECLIEADKHLNVQIFATDIDSKAIEKARAGCFAGIESDVGEERLKRFFSFEGNQYRIRKEIREMLIFATQSVIKDPPFTKLDLISCRNLLIYFNSELQKKTIPLFHYSLASKGILFLGSSESISGFVDLFTLVDKKWKIYKRRDSEYSVQPFIEFPLSGTKGRVFESIGKMKEKNNDANLAAAVDKKYYGTESEKLIKNLEYELRTAKDNLRSTIEELKTSNEELRSTNEEMQSANEEMQSTNEELETSKEELQSLNEELVIVNSELQHKNDELMIINNDMKNLMDSVDIPTIFLDKDLLIKRFSFYASRMVNLIASDIGRPIEHIATNLKYNDLAEDAKEVLRTLAFKVKDVQTKDGCWYRMRIRPYRTYNDALDGVIITFEDINDFKKAAEEIDNLNKIIRETRRYADDIINALAEPVLILNSEMKVLAANSSFYKTFVVLGLDTIGKCLFDLDNNNWNIPKLRESLEGVIPGRKLTEELAVEYNSVKTGRKNLLINVRQIFQEETETKIILLEILCRSTN